MRTEARPIRHFTNDFASLNGVLKPQGNDTINPRVNGKTKYFHWSRIDGISKPRFHAIASVMMTCGITEGGLNWHMRFALRTRTPQIQKCHQDYKQNANQT
jgi:hypothetical protein